MHSVSLEQLAERIPRPFEKWDTNDIHNWFSMNEIQINYEDLQKHNITGQTICQVTPEDWMKLFGCTLFIAKRIVEWVEEEVQEFNDLVSDEENMYQYQEGEEQIDQISSVKMLRNESIETNLKNGGDFPEENKENIENSMEREQGQVYMPCAQQNYVKFAKSHLQTEFNTQRTYEKIIKFKSKDVQIMITGDSKIGRSKSNHICLTEESVSRCHAQIIANKDPYSLQPTKYYLIDIGSKFGTYVPIQGRVQIQAGDQFSLSTADIKILSLTISPKGNLKSKFFDVKILLNRQEQMTFTNRTNLTLSRKGEVKLVNCEINTIYKIFIDKKGVFLEGSESNVIFQKLKQKQKWDIEQNIGASNRVNIIFGSLMSELQLLKRCRECLEINQCQC